MLQNKSKLIAIAVIVVVAIVLASIFLRKDRIEPVSADSVPESSEPIKLAVHEWTGQHITTYITGEVLKKMGYNVEYHTASYLPSATGIADGNLTASLEVWDNNLGDFFPSLIEEGKIENLGNLGLDTNEGWLYPNHVADMCPGLPDWDALMQCAEVLGTPETLPNGRVLAYPADWGDRSAQLIEGESLPFEAVPAGSEGAMVAELKGSVQRQSALVMMFWSPHQVFHNVDVTWIDMPDSIREKYGIYKPTTFKAVWSGTKDQWPAAYLLMKQFKLTNEIQLPLMDMVDNQGGNARQVAEQWVNENAAYWQPIVDSVMK